MPIHWDSVIMSTYSEHVFQISCLYIEMLLYEHFLALNYNER